MLLLEADISLQRGVTEIFGGVPKPALYMGLCGVVPYAVASFSTLYLSWNISKSTMMAKYMNETTQTSGTLKKITVSILIKTSLGD